MVTPKEYNGDTVDRNITNHGLRSRWRNGLGNLEHRFGNLTNVIIVNDMCISIPLLFYSQDQDTLKKHHDTKVNMVSIADWSTCCLLRCCTTKYIVV